MLFDATEHAITEVCDYCQECYVKPVILPVANTDSWQAICPRCKCRTGPVKDPFIACLNWNLLQRKENYVEQWLFHCSKVPRWKSA